MGRIKVADIKDVGIGPNLFPEPKGAKLAQQPAYLAVRITNIAKYAGHGHVTLTFTDPTLKIVARDHGPGIPNVDEILGGTYKSKTGMGLGLLGMSKILDTLNIDTGPEMGTRVTGTKSLN